MESIENAMNFVMGIIWNPFMIWLCLLVGLLYTVIMKGFQVTYIKDMFRLLVGVNAKKSPNGMSSFEAFTLSISGRVGTGNVVGVATAIAYGGPGAVFWMWMLAFLGAATTFAENSLAQLYKQKVDKLYRGGGAYYIEKGLKCKWLAVIFAFLGFFQTGVFTGIQPQTMAASMNQAFGIPKETFGLVLIAILALIIFGGIRRIAAVASKLAPFMAISYLLLAFAIIATHFSSIPSVFSTILSSAFGFNSLFGGIVGSAITMGIKRGVYSSEAGMGTSSQHGATADVSHPAKQGLVQSLSVYIDTLGVCTATAFMLLITGMYNVYGSDNSLIYEGLSQVSAGSGYAQAAVSQFLPNVGSQLVGIFLSIFAFTTILATFNIAETNLIYLYKGYANNRIAQILFRSWYLVPMYLGCVISADLAWNIADIGVGLQVWVTLITLILLTPKVKVIWDDYVTQKKQGKDPIFRPSRLNIENAELWESIADHYEQQQDTLSEAKLSKATS